MLRENDQSGKENMSNEENLENLKMYVTLRTFWEDTIVNFEYLKISHRKGIWHIFCELGVRWSRGEDMIVADVKGNLF